MWPTREELGHEKISNPYIAISFTEWAREIKDLISMEIISWNKLVREMKQNTLYFDFKGRFFAVKPNLKALYELCMGLDQRKVKKSDHLSITSKLKLKCEFCGRLGHTQKNCFKKQKPEFKGPLNNSIYSVKDGNLNIINNLNDSRNCKLMITDKVYLNALLDSESDSKFLKYED